MTNSYIDYYNRKGIIPVHQEVDHQHKVRRIALYRTLGLHPLAFHGSRVLELGPGTGDNAQILSQVGPCMLTLVDGAKPSYQILLEKLKSGKFHCPTEVIYSDIFQYQAVDEVDIVICEGCSAQVSPSSFYKKILSIPTGPFGSFCLSTADSVSVLSELVRMHWWHVLAELSEADQLCFGKDIFSKDFLSLPNTSRSCSDWILDNILHPRPDNWSFGIHDLINLVSECHPELVFLSSSPRYYTDWNWYKNYPQLQEHVNAKALELWNHVFLYTIDSRLATGLVEFPFIDESIGLQARSICDHISLNVSAIYKASFEDRRSLISDSIKQLCNLEQLLDFNPRFLGTRTSIACAANELKVMLDFGSDSKYGSSFCSWWGVGQQYISFSKHII